MVGAQVHRRASRYPDNAPAVPSSPSSTPLVGWVDPALRFPTALAQLSRTLSIGCLKGAVTTDERQVIRLVSHLPCGALIRAVTAPAMVRRLTALEPAARAPLFSGPCGLKRRRTNVRCPSTRLRSKRLIAGPVARAHAPVGASE